MKNNDLKNTEGTADLIASLETLEKRKLEIMDEGNVKSKIWAKIEPHVRATSRAELKELAENIVAVPSVDPSLARKASIKETVMNYVENLRVRKGFLLGRKRFFAAASIMAVLSFAFYPSLRFFPSVSAEKNTFVNVEQGNVEILRDGAVINVNDDNVLMEGDVIRVLSGSLAQVYFMDDSRVALGPDTEVYLDRLYIDENNESSTQVEMILNEGKAWVQVLNLFGDRDYFSVLTNKGEFVVDRAADMNVEAEGDDISVEVAGNLVSFTVPYGESYKEGILGEGTRVSLGDDELLIEAVEDKSDDVWWNYNLLEGENHISYVSNYYITESAGKVELLPGDPLHDLKEFKHVVSDAISFESKTEKDLNLAGSRLAEAEQLISEGDDEGAHEKLNAYVDIVEDVVADDSFSDSDIEAVEAHVDGATKALSVKMMGNEDLSVVQDTLDKVDEITSEDEKDKTIKKVDNASNKLQNALNFVNGGSYDSALECLENYADQVKEIVMDISEVSAEDRAQVVTSVLDKKIENLQTLKIIIDKLESEGVDSSEAAEIKSQTLFEINALVVSLKERAITKLTDFLSEVQSDENIQIQVLGNLKKNVVLDMDVIEKINDIEEVYFDEGEIVFLVK